MKEEWLTAEEALKEPGLYIDNRPEPKHWIITSNIKPALFCFDPSRWTGASHTETGFKLGTSYRYRKLM
jgi:hypothetical protein